MTFHIFKDNEQLGPFEEAEVQRQLQDGTLTCHDLVWAEGMSEWQPLHTVLPAAPGTAPTSPAAPTVEMPEPPQEEAAAVATAATPPADPNQRYRCNNQACRKVWVEADLKTVQCGPNTLRLCPKCKMAVAPYVPEPGFFMKIPGAFGYPFAGGGYWILVLGTPLLAFLEFAKRTGLGFALGIANIFVFGFFGMVLIHVVRSTCHEEREPLSWPRLGDWDEVQAVARQVLGSGLLVFAPAILCFLVGTTSLLGDYGSSLMEPEIWHLLAMICAIAGVLYYPMGFLAVAMFDNAFAANPMVVLPAILRTFLHYVPVAVLLVTMSVLCQMVSALILVLPFGPRIAVLLPLEFFSFYVLVVSARLLGLLYRSNWEKLGWFQQPPG